MRYLSQRFSMPYPELKGLLTDIGTEELGHLEMVGTILYQLTRDMSPEEIKKVGFDTYFIDHTAGVYPMAASGFPWSAASIGVKGDVIADVNNVIKYLREREIVHYQRFGEALRRTLDRLDEKNVYALNPSFS